MLRRFLTIAVLASAVVLAGCGPIAPAPPTRAQVVTIPASIDATGRTDVSQAFAAFVASVPDGSRIELASGGQYRMESTWFVRDRHDLTIDGNGAKIFATTPGTRGRSHVSVQRGSGLVFENLRVQGANPAAGRDSDAAYQPDKEAQHGFDVQGTQHVQLIGVTVTDVYGDFVCITKIYGGPWADDVRITNSTFARNGRQGITIAAARNVVIEHNTLSDMRRSTFDLEPGRTDGWGADNVSIRDNTIGSGRLNFVAAAGRGPLDNITVEGNHLKGQALQIYVIDKDGGMRRNWKVLNNVSDVSFATPNQAAMQFWRVNGLTVRGNRQVMKAAFVMYGVRAEASCNLALDGNDYPNARGQSLVIGGC